MARLAVRIDAPVAVVGRPFDVVVEITASRPTKIDHVAVRLIGRQGWAAGGVYRRELFPDLITYVNRDTTLHAGVNRIMASFELGDGPPSHELEPAWARYELHARVATKWWFGGAQASVPIEVRAAPLATPRYPMVVRTHATAPIRLAVSLASTRVVAGEVVHGRCAVHGLPDDRPREITLSLEPVLVLRSTLIGNVVIRHNRHVTQAVLPAGTGGTSVPFSFVVPEKTTPTFRALSHELWRELVISTDHLRLVVPLEVLDPTAEVGPMPVAPLLGGERVGTTFEQFAIARNWRRADRGTSHAVVRSTDDDIVFRIECEFRGKDGTWLVASLTYPSLGLGLEVTPASLLRNVLGDVAVGDPDWDRAHDVQARSAEQARPFVAAVAPATTSPVLGMLLRWTDDTIVYEQRVDEVTEELLGAVADALGTVCDSIEEHRALIGPAPEVDIDREHIRALARELRGRLALGNLAIDGWLGELPVAIRTQWERVRATRISVVVGSADTSTEFSRMVDVAISRPATDAPSDPEAKRLVGLAQWSRDIVELRVAGGIASAELLLDTEAERVAIDVERVRRLVEALHAIRVALEPASGPYR